MLDRTIEYIREGLDSGRLNISRLEDGSGVVLDVDRELLLSMNDSGLAIMECIAGGHVSTTALLEQLVAHFDCNHERAEDDLSSFLTRLQTTLGFKPKP